MEEKFIDLDESKETADKNKINLEQKSKTFNRILPITFGKKRKVKDVKKPSPKKKFEMKYFLRDSIEPNKYDINIEKYVLVEMNEEDNSLMKCYEYIKENPEIKLNERKTINILDKNITFTLVRRKPFLRILIGNNTYYFDENAREIIFVDKLSKQITKKFISNPDILKSTLGNLGFNSYYVKIYKNKNDKNNNSLNLIKEKESDSESSEVSLDPATIFYDNNIKFIFNESQKSVLNENNFNKRFSSSLFLLSSLNDNSKYYYKYSNNIFHEIDYNNILENFRIFKDNYASKTVYLYGPKGCSKTTFLLYMINSFNCMDLRSLYFNFNYLENTNILQRKRVIYHEILYFCKDIDEMKKIANKKIFNNIADKNNIMKLIYLILNILFEVIDCNNNVIRLIIIDNIYNNEKEIIDDLNNIIKFITNKNSNIKIIICGRGPYFNQLFIDYYLKFQVLTNDDKYQKNKLSQFFYIYNADKNEFNKYNEKEKEENENLNELFLKKQLENKVYSFYKLYFSEELDKKDYSFQTIKNNMGFISQLPLEYFEIKIIKKKDLENPSYLNFSFYDDSFKKCFKNIIGCEIERDTLTNLLKRNDYPKTFLGVCFEKLITLLLMYNKLNLDNLTFKKSNILEISEIVKLKEENYSGKIFTKYEKNEPILVVQENFFGPLYDLLIITKNDNYYYSDFIQIGADKTKQQIKQIINDLQTKYKIYKDNIFKAFNINSDYISVSFIFDYDTQKEKKYLYGFKTCQEENINFYLFSQLDCSLIELNENKDNKILVNKYYPSYIINEKKKKNIEIRKKKKVYNKDNSKNEKITNFFKKDN